MNFLFKNINEIGDWENDIFSMILSCDEEFLPPLTQKRVITGEENKKDLIRKYIEEKRDTNAYILVYEGNEIIGFVNYIENFYLEGFPFSLHIDTICIARNYRGIGISQILYNKIEEIAEEKNINYITLGTWSTHNIQKYLMNKMNYKIWLQKKDGKTKGIDHLIYGKKI